MSAVWAVIRREYVQRVRSKWFLITTFAAPLLFLLMTLAPIYLGSRGERAQRRLVVVDRTGSLFERLLAPLEEAGFEVERGSVDPEAEGDLRRRAAAREIGGYVILDDATLARGTVRYVGRSAPSALRQLAFQQTVARAVLEERLGGTDADVAALLSGGEIQVEVLGEEGRGFEDPSFVRVYVGTFLLYMIVLLYAVGVMRSVLEEKTSRIVEVVISSIRPWHLMLGKILGVGAVGLTQLAVWVGLGFLTVLAGVPALLAARPDLVQLQDVSQYLPGAGFLGLFLIFFLGGYFIFSGLYAAVGAMCNNEQEAQQTQVPVVLLLMTPAVLLIAVMQDPSSSMAVTLSLVPFFSPVIMFARAAMGAAPVWQVVLSVVLMAATVVAIAWVAGRIYKTGILMAGKRPTLPELVRWVREA
ncbi:MAG: ABC transporter permease [Gemmatimonadota bacterium]